MACNSQHDLRTDSDFPYKKCEDEDERRCPSPNCKPFLKDAIDRYQDRREGLDGQWRMLHDKIDIMERSIPALMALSMWKAEDESQEPAAALERVREMMRNLSPLPDPIEELVGDLANRVEQLNRETAELHDKIINADVQIEENCMELESVEQVNRELEEQIQCFEHKLVAQPSLQSITSDDRICLTKIRKLAEDEVRMKKSVRELEEREAILRCQLEKILRPKEAGTKKMCAAVQARKHHVHRSKNRKKKECHKLETSVQSLFERDKCCKTGCDALKKMIEQNLPMTCKCQKQVQETVCNKSSIHLTHSSVKNSQLNDCNQICIHSFKTSISQSTFKKPSSHFAHSSANTSRVCDCNESCQNKSQKDVPRSETSKNQLKKVSNSYKIRNKESELEFGDVTKNFRHLIDHSDTKLGECDCNETETIKL